MHGLTEAAPGVAASRHIERIEQAFPHAAIALLLVPEREDRVADIARLRLFRVLVVEPLQDVGAAGQEIEDDFVLHLAAVLELRDRLKAAGAAGVSDDEDRIAL